MNYSELLLSPRDTFGRSCSLNISMIQFWYFSSFRRDQFPFKLLTDCIGKHEALLKLCLIDRHNFRFVLVGGC
jgi:hypothetical protein